MAHHPVNPVSTGTLSVEPNAEARRSQQRWLTERRYLNGHRHDLVRAAQHLYPAEWRVAGTPLLARPEWRPAAPVPLEAVTISWRPGRHDTVIDPVHPAGSASVRPLRDDGSRFPSYADALAALDPPRLLENRTCYRLLEARTAGDGTGEAAGPGAGGGTGGGAELAFGLNRYFDLINNSEAIAHETAGQPPGARLAMSELPLRSSVGDPLDLARRSVTTGIGTLILRADRAAGTAQMILHWRDPARVAVNGGLYQVAPAGMFQPSHEAEWNLANDLGLWEAIAREVSEELLGTSEDHGSDAAPIDYQGWPFFRALTGAREAGTLRGYWLGVGADPLTLDVDLLTVLVFDAPFFDAEFGGLVAANEEGYLLTGPAGGGGDVGLEFGAESVERFTTVEAMQPAGQALLRLAWQHRGVLLGA